MRNGTLASKKLRKLREELGMTQNDLANASGISESQIRNLEMRPATWDGARHTTILNISRALGVEPEFFFTEDDSDVNPPRPIRVRARNHFSAVQPTIQIHKPFRDDIHELPRQAHRQEPWNDQYLCLMEHIRQAVIQYADGDVDDLNVLIGAIDNAVLDWGEQHGVQPSVHADLDDDDDSDNDVPVDLTDPRVALIQPDDEIYTKAKGFIPGVDDRLRPAGTADSLGWKSGTEVVTVQARDWWDGKYFDAIKVDGRVYYIVCKHSTKSRKVEDHQYLIAGTKSAPLKQNREDAMRPKKKKLA